MEKVFEADPELLREMDLSNLRDFFEESRGLIFIQGQSGEFKFTRS
jgi:hypothetical protein